VTFAHLEASIECRDLCRTAPNYDLGFFRTRDIDPVKTILVEYERGVRRVDLESGEGRSQTLKTNDGGAFGQFKLCNGVCKVSYRDRSTLREPDVITVSQLDFGSPALTHVELVARQERQVLNDIGPFGHTCSQEGHIAIDEAQAGDALDWFVVVIDRLGVLSGLMVRKFSRLSGDLCKRACGEEAKCEDHGEREFHDLVPRLSKRFFTCSDTRTSATDMPL
jgi:hypothetical protein